MKFEFDALLFLEFSVPDEEVNRFGLSVQETMQQNMTSRIAENDASFGNADFYSLSEDAYRNIQRPDAEQMQFFLPQLSK